MSNDYQNSSITFEDLDLSEPVFKAIKAIGYEVPSAIQAETIPLIMARRDVVGQAQTGTGKTGAFALPLLSKIQVENNATQVLVLCPTRELAIQVAEAFQKYAEYISGFHVLPIYGGAGYGPQLKMLRRGVQVIVATPGRLVDHMKKGTLKLDSLECLVIDEADEMLRMGFIEEVEWIIQQTPETRQILLFSATMPREVRRIATGYLKDPAQITIKNKTETAATIRQRYWMVSGMHKLDALTRILEGSEFDAIIIFVRTKSQTTELARKLEARGFSASPLNGDIIQRDREITVDQLKTGEIDIIVATDVAARGLDVPRISHVINYDIPTETEAYVHRIGRTGRAGREGEAILFVSPRERRMLNAIEKATRQKIELMQLPSVASINDLRVSKFKEKVRDTLGLDDLGKYMQVVEEIRAETNVPSIEIAAALAKISQGESDLFIQGRDPKPTRETDWASDSYDSGSGRKKGRREKGGRNDDDKETYRLSVGRKDDVKPGQIVGAIANEAGLDGKQIGAIKINESWTTVDLPKNLPAEIISGLKDTRVAGRKLNIKLADPNDVPPSRSYDKKTGGKFDRRSDKSFDKKKSTFKKFKKD